MKIKLLSIICAANLFGCSTTNISYNPKEFDTINYQKNVANAVDASDILNDFDQANTPKQNLDSADFSKLIQADILFNQANYISAYKHYAQLVPKYQDPRIIYKAIVCLEHFSNTQEQINTLNSMVNLFIKVSPNSQLAKLFQIKVALNTNDLALAKNDLDGLMEHNSQNGRAILLFISSLLTSDLNGASSSTLSDFAAYVAKKYKAYPESNLVGAIAYASANNYEGLKNQLKFIQKKFPNWDIPAIWSIAIFAKNGSQNQIIDLLNDNIKSNSHPDIVLQNMYISALIKSKQFSQAISYTQQSIDNNQNRNNALINMGILKMLMASYTEALNSFNLANPSEISLASIIKLTMGNIYDYQGDTSNAIKYYEQVNVNDPYLKSSAEMLIINDYALLDDKNKINQVLDELAIKNKLNPKQAILFKAQIYVNLEYYQDAYNLLDKNLKQYSNDKDYLYMYTAMSGILKKTNQAIKLYKQYIKLDPMNAFGYNDLAFIYADQTHDYKHAFQYATKALELNAIDPNVLDTMGWVYYKQGNYNLALKYVKASLDKNYAVESAKHLKAIYLALNQKEMAQNVIILTKDQVQKNNKQLLLNKAISLLIYLQFGLVVK